MQSTAAHPRASHLEYVGTILPIRHPWWDTHMPPSDWNCACSVRPTDADVTPVPGDEFVSPVFSNNPGKTAEFVKIDETTYFKETKKDDRKVVIYIADNLFKEYIDSISDKEVK